MANPIAEAFVRISPNFAQFRERLLAGIQREIDSIPASLTPKVPVRLIIGPGEREELRKQIALIEGAIIRVKPVITGAPVAAAATTSGFFTPPAGTPAPPPTGGAGGAANAANAATRARTSAEAALAKELDRLKVIEQGLSTKTTELAKARDLERRAGESEIRVAELAQKVQRENINLDQEEIAKVQALAAEQKVLQGARVSAAEGAALQASAAVIPAAAATVAAVDPNAGIDRARARTRARLAVEEEAAAKQAAKQITKTFAEREAAEIAEAATLAKTTKQDIALFRASVEAAHSAAIAEDAIFNRTAALRSRVSGIASSAGSRADVTAASKAITSAKRLETEAIASQNPILIANARALVADADAAHLAAQSALTNATAQRAAAKAAAESATTTATAARGAGATALSFAGLRGATLAASGAFLAGAAGAAIFAKSLGAFANFETTLNTFQAVTGATADQMERVSEAARQLGNDLTLPSVSASDAATAMSELAKAGLSVTQAIAASRGVLQLATAANIDNAQAVELVATALNAFHLAGRDAIDVADGFANAANAAQGSISDFGVAMGQTAAVADQVGLSFKDTIALLTIFARNGLRGSDAGTSLRTALIKLIAPTKQADQVIQALGLHIRDAQGNIRPDIFAQFGEATRNLSPELRDTFAEIIAGTDAIRAFAIGAREGTQGLADAQQQIDKQGTAAEVAAARTRGLAGEAEAFKNSAATLAITVGRGLAPSVEHLTEAATRAVGGLGGVTSVIGSLAKHLGPLGSALGGVTKAFGAGIAPILAIVAAYKAYGLASNTVAAARAKVIANQRILIVGTREEAAAFQAAAAAATELGLAEQAGALGKARAISTTRGLALASRTLITPLNIALTAATGLGFALQFLGKHEDAAKKSTDALIDSIRELGQVTGASAKITERAAIEGIVEALNKQAEAQARVAAGVGLRGVPQDSALRRTNEQKAQIQAQADSVDAFIKNINKGVTAADAVGDDLTRHNLLLLRDFTRQLGQLPSKREIKLFISNDQAKTSLTQIADQLINLGGKAREDGFKLATQLAEGLSQGISERKRIPPEALLPDTTRASELAKNALGLGKLLPTLSGDQKAKTLADFRSLIDQLAALGPAGQVKLKQLGKDLINAFAKGISDEDKAAIAAANQAVSDAIESGRKQVDEAVNSAKSNLGSIASSLASSVGQVLDARAEAAIKALDNSDLGKEIKRLTAELDKTNVRTQRNALEASFLGASDAASQQQALGQIETFDLQNKLTSDQKKIDSAKKVIKETSDAQKEAVTKNLAAYAEQFAKGQITLAQFKGRVLTTLHKQVPDFQKVGKDLGFAFGSAFQAQVEALLDQAALLTGFQGRTPGGTTQVNKVSPGEALAAANKEIHDAKVARDKLVTGSAAQLTELKLIRIAVQGKPGGGLKGGGGGNATASTSRSTGGMSRN